MAENPIQYTSRTYDSVLADINLDAELVDKPVWFKRLIAGFADVVSLWNNSVANLSFLRTAFTKQAIVDHLEMLDYFLTPSETSSGTQRFNFIDSVVFPVTILKADLAAALRGSTSISSFRFEGRADAVQAAVTSNFTANAGTDQITLPAAATWVQTGTKVGRLLTTGTLPAPLVGATSYYIIRVSDTVFKLAATEADAYAGNPIDITTAGTGTHNVALLATFVSMYQQETKAQYVVGKSDGASLWQEFNLTDLKVIKGTENIIINGDTWTRVDTFVNSGPSDKHYRLLSRTDGTPYIRFGNGVYGAIPAVFDIFVDYAVGGGSTSNVTATNKVISYVGSDANIESTSNSTTYTGGVDEESTENAKKLAPVVLKAQDRFISDADGVALAKKFGGVARARVNRNFYGLLSAQVVIVPNGGGLPSLSLKASLQAYLIDRTILESVDVRVVDPVYTAVNFTSQIKVLPSYSFANVQPLYELAVKLLFSEITPQIQDVYNGVGGITAAVNFINSVFGYSFTTAQYGQIRVLLEKVPTFDFGGVINLSDVYGFLDSYVDGVDYLTISAPSFPLSFANDQIATVGTITTTQIP